MFEEEILPRLVKIAIAALIIFSIGAAGGFLAGRYLFPHCPVALGTLSVQTIPPELLSPDEPPVPVIAAPDAVLNYALADLWAYTSARDRAVLRGMLYPLQDWARDHWPPFPDECPP